MSSNIRFAHIAPTSYLYELTASNGIHLILAHLVESDENYRNFYKNLNDGRPKILDNSAYEMFKQGKPMYDTNKLIHAGLQVNADYIVLSDYPNKNGQYTIDSANNNIDYFKSEGFKTFFVPQSKERDLIDYIETFRWGINNLSVDLVGVSILGVPNAFGVLNNKCQRFYSRWKMMKTLEDYGVLDMHNENHQKRLHFLGMLDGPNEISLVKKYHSYIYSWDSSAAVWSGFNNIEFDNTPTGLRNGKLDIEVDFKFRLNRSNEESIRMLIAKKNIATINAMVSR